MPSTATAEGEAGVHQEPASGSPNQNKMNRTVSGQLRTSST